MADTVDKAEFWFPTRFLAEEAMFMDKENLHKNGVDSGIWANKLFFPDDLFDSSPSLNSPVESLVGSTETESDEEDLLTEFTRQLARSSLSETKKHYPSEKWLMSGSPQSTLSSLRSWSCSPNGPFRKPSPPVTPPSSDNDPWDVIYAAAGQVARMKMNHENQHMMFGSPDQILAHRIAQLNQLQNLRQGHALKQQSASIWGRQAEEAAWVVQQRVLAQQQLQSRERCSVGQENGRCGVRPLGLPQSAWPPLQQHQQRSRSSPAAFFGANGGCDYDSPKRECTGTGVFLPRRYNSFPETRKKSGCPVDFPSTRAVQALNTNVDDMNARVPPRFSNGSCPHTDALIARRNALFIEQQKRSLRSDVGLNSEMLLPQEWTY